MMRSLRTDIDSQKGKGGSTQAVSVPQPPTPRPGGERGAGTPAAPHVQKDEHPSPAQHQNEPPPNLPHIDETPPTPPQPSRPSAPPIPPARPPRPLPVGLPNSEPARPPQPAASFPAPAPAQPAPRPAPTGPGGDERFVPPHTGNTPSGRGRKRTLFLGLGALLIIVLIGFEVWWFFVRPDGEESVTRPTGSTLPSPEETLPTELDDPGEPTVASPTIAQPFLAFADTQTISLNAPERATIVAALNQSVAAQRQHEALVRLVFLVTEGNVQRELTWNELAAALELTVPATVSAQLTPTYNIFLLPTTVYDTAQCNEAGVERPDCAGPRLGIALAATNSAALSSSLGQWEATMVRDLRNLIVAEVTGETRPFLDATYNAVPVRYRNLPLPTVTIDYALTNNLLIITTSKSSMFAAIDAL